MEDVIKLLVADAQNLRAEIQDLHAEVGALRVLLGAVLVGNAGALAYLETVARNIDDITMPFAMNETQREIVRERVMKTLELIKAVPSTSPGATQ